MTEEFGSFGNAFESWNGFFCYHLRMHRLVLPLCVIGVLLGAGTAHGFFSVWSEMKEHWNETAEQIIEAMEDYEHSVSEDTSSARS
jgi:hypothetical protein